MKIHHVALWGILALILLAAAFFPLNVLAQTEPPVTPQDTGTIFLPLVSSGSGSRPTPVPTPRPTIIPNPQLGNIIDHTTLPLFDQIPAQYLRAAEQIRFHFIDSSVGQNIYEGLECLSASSWGASPSRCRRHYTDASLTSWKTFTTNDTNIPAVIQFPGGNDNRNIYFNFMGPEEIPYSGTWYGQLEFFVTTYPAQANDWDIISLKHNYLHVSNETNIDISRVYFDPNYNGYNIYDVLDLEARYPNKVFVYWTTSLARTIGTIRSESFNNQMRQFARDNNKILIDVADILSHTPEGNACRNSQGYQIICREYTTESEGGHLGSVSGGQIRLAKAVWIMLAQLAGWQGP
ncbi:MAG: hypothetical protein AB1453_03170 [Chloroflexota bacterium]